MPIQGRTGVGTSLIIPSGNEHPFFHCTKDMAWIYTITLLLHSPSNRYKTLLLPLCFFLRYLVHTPPAIQLFLDRNWTDLTKDALYNEIVPNFESLGGRGWYETVVVWLQRAFDRAERLLLCLRLLPSDFYLQTRRGRTYGKRSLSLIVHYACAAPIVYLRHLL